MGNGQWTMGNGQWAIGNGRWTMDDEQWTMDNNGQPLCKSNTKPALNIALREGLSNEFSN